MPKNNSETILQMIDETAIVYIDDGDVLNEKSIDECKSFVNNKPITIPDYVDFHPNGDVTLIWRKAKKGMAGLWFTGDNNLIYTYSLENGEEYHDLIPINDLPSKFIEIVEALNYV